MQPPITKDSITSAHEKIKPYIHRTPVMTSAGVDEKTGARLFFKCENFQKIGAFKARGAMNAILSLTPEARDKGVVTHSSGNHGQALARAAKIIGVPSYIVMPNNVPEIKKRGVLGYGGTIIECEPTLAAREKGVSDIIQKTGATEIHPFNNYDVMTGQATAAKELFEDVQALDYLIAPVGGGGLLSGTTMSTRYFSPQTIVLAAEPEQADDAFRSMKSGKIEPSQSNSVADGLLTSLGTKTFPIIHEYVQEVITVSEIEIISAMKFMWERMKIVVEPSGAVPLAAVLKSKNKFQNKQVGIIITGGNVDLAKALSLFNQIG
ncbi:MAG TPA: pyridoxal-phosphate dependent enzyme [Ohtaekwangia sp.]